ncbi:MAG: Fis family transcriptional regulator [Thiotrichaceae bacterium]|nr:Fis family transcriptional regulator [Thiotrichaceae bacterium]PCI12571.1 MAG: Fis family transcriptional regulator [Thiotrichales bacterium]
MRKTDKKIDNQLSLALTRVCDSALEQIDGFQWLTHMVDYSNCPKSLKVVCIFDTNDNLSDFMASGGHHELTSLIRARLHGVVADVKNMADHILYDTEEDCAKYHNGKWTDRLI